ncbi:unnamed protein product [Orchesella dallaii]|uniref:Odorant receptor n=1 Tax=Orchesella dallaii TaxID=48710 RepID=A0ABP1RDY4_9HEXA
MSSAKYTWDVFDLHHRFFTYVPYPQLLVWDGNKRQIFCTPQKHLILWYFAIFVIIILLGVVASGVILLEQLFGNPKVSGLVKTLQLIVVGLFAAISGGTGVAVMLYGERTAVFFNRLVALEKYLSKVFTPSQCNCSLRSLQRFSNTSSKYLTEERMLEVLMKGAVLIGSIFAIPVSTMGMINNMDPIGHLLECYILPEPYNRTTPIIVFSFITRLLICWMASVETARSISLLILVFHTVIQIYLKLLHQMKVCSSSKRKEILKFYTLLQMIHVDAEPCGNALIAILMGSGAGLYTTAVWVTVKGWKQVPFFLYIFAFSFSFIIPGVIMALLPYAVKIRQNSSKIILGWKLECSLKWYSNSFDRRCVRMRIKALRFITFSCGNYFHLKRTTKRNYLHATVDLAVESLMTVPAPSGNPLDWFEF